MEDQKDYTSQMFYYDFPGNNEWLPTIFGKDQLSNSQVNVKLSYTAWDIKLTIMELDTAKKLDLYFCPQYTNSALVKFNRKIHSFDDSDIYELSQSDFDDRSGSGVRFPFFLLLNYFCFLRFHSSSPQKRANRRVYNKWA